MLKVKEEKARYIKHKAFPLDLEPTVLSLLLMHENWYYNGHKGTDFGIADLQVMARGMPVVAAVSGMVLRTRDGIQDLLIENQNQRQSVAEKECGNGLVIDRGNGWEIKYCHLEIMFLSNSMVRTKFNLQRKNSGLRLK